MWRSYDKPISKYDMEELAAHQRTLKKPSGGISFARNVDGEAKSAARQAVLDLFTRDKWPNLNMFTMPGIHWRFERMMLGMRQPGWMKHAGPRGTHFTGVENDRAIYYSSLTQMPGTETPYRLIKPVKRERFPFAEHAFKTKYVSYFFANVDDMLTFDWPQPPYRDTPRGWNAAWLDYTGPLSVERMEKIRFFYENFIHSTLIVTALKARWNTQTVTAIKAVGGHSDWLRKNLPGDVLHDLEYQDTSPMAQYAVRKA